MKFGNGFYSPESPLSKECNWKDADFILSQTPEKHHDWVKYSTGVQHFTTAKR